MTLFNNLFKSGFNLTEIVHFLQRSQLLASCYTEVIQSGLVMGQPFSKISNSLGFSDNVVTQLSLAEAHGNLSLCLDKVEAYLEEMMKVRKKLIEVVSYPMMLLAFLLLIMVGLKNYLLPQLIEGKGNLASQILSQFPIIIIGFLLSLVLGFLVFRFWMRCVIQIRAYSFLVKVPGLRSLIRLYLTAYYAREWGNLISQGLEMSHIVEIMVEQPDRLFAEIGEDMLRSLSNGQGFHEKVKEYPFFERELSLMIEYGEAKSKLGKELEIYAQDCWERFFTKVNRSMQLVQPLIFMFVAIVIVLIYAAMLLPIYNNMEVHL